VEAEAGPQAQESGRTEADLESGKLSTADRWIIGQVGKLGKEFGFHLDADDIERALPRGYKGFLTGAKGAIVALGIVGALWAGLRWWRKRQEGAWEKVR
jgi:hypothetical protein